MTENSGVKRKLTKPVKIGLIAGIIMVLAGASAAYAFNAGGALGGISEAEARQIALNEVQGAQESDITKSEKDYDNGRVEYDIEIIYGGYEYDFEISAADGTIFDRSKELLDDDDVAATPDTSGTTGGTGQVVVTQPTTNSSSDIGLEKAKSIAMGQVGGGSIVKAYKDYDDGRLEYDVEIHYNGYEYDFEIDGASGSILSKDVDRIEYDDDDYYDDYDD
ncbi:MAG: PepSY domain-containing protein [Bacillota bacterium]|nr:PepSY domain-containing protein [Bacillota bacterium]